MHHGRGDHPALAPEYVHSFSCTGGRCEDNCCAGGWTVFVDRPAYKRCRNLALRDRQFEECLRHVSLNKAGKDWDYAFIKAGDDQKCPLLTSQGECTIHKKYGESFLPDTCSIYPRMLYKVNNHHLCLGTFSCPEMARLGLLNREGVKLSQYPIKDLMPRYGLDKSVAVDEARYFEILGLAIEVLQERSLAVEERLLLLGMAAQKLGAAGNKGYFQSCRQIRGILRSGFIREELSRLPSQPEIQIQIFKKIAEERLKANIVSDSFLNIFNKALTSFGFLNGGVSAPSAGGYGHVLAELKGELANYHYVFENYLVNSVLKDDFALSGNIFDEYIKIVVKFALIRALTAGVAWHDRKLTEDSLAGVIQSFSRVADHNSIFLNAVNKMLGENGLDSLPYMAVLLKI